MLLSHLFPSSAVPNPQKIGSRCSGCLSLVHSNRKCGIAGLSSCGEIHPKSHPPPPACCRESAFCSGMCGIPSRLLSRCRWMQSYNTQAAFNWKMFFSSLVCNVFLGMHHFAASEEPLVYKRGHWQTSAHYIPNTWEDLRAEAGLPNEGWRWSLCCGLPSLKATLANAAIPHIWFVIIIK